MSGSRMSSGGGRFEGRLLKPAGEQPEDVAADHAVQDGEADAVAFQGGGHAADDGVATQCAAALPGGEAQPAHGGAEAKLGGCGVRMAERFAQAGAGDIGLGLLIPGAGKVEFQPVPNLRLAENIPMPGRKRLPPARQDLRQRAQRRDVGMAGEGADLGEQVLGDALQPPGPADVDIEGGQMPDGEGLVFEQEPAGFGEILMEIDPVERLTGQQFPAGRPGAAGRESLPARGGKVGCLMRIALAADPAQASRQPRGIRTGWPCRRRPGNNGPGAGARCDAASVLRCGGFGCARFEPCTFDRLTCGCGTFGCDGIGHVAASSGSRYLSSTRFPWRRRRQTGRRGAAPSRKNRYSGIAAA